MPKHELPFTDQPLTRDGRAQLNRIADYVLNDYEWFQGIDRETDEYSGRLKTGNDVMQVLDALRGGKPVPDFEEACRVR